MNKEGMQKFEKFSMFWIVNNFDLNFEQVLPKYDIAKFFPQVNFSDVFEITFIH